jgi:integrase
LKASFKIIKSKKSDDLKGLYISLVDGKARATKLLFTTDVKYWDQVNQTLLTSHPNYALLIPDLLNAKAKITRVNYGKYTFAEAKSYLFGSEDLKYGVFKSLVSKYLTNTSNGKIYQTVINSFNSVYPDVRIDKITPDMARVYMRTLMLRNKPNGVHTYMVKLTALFNKVSDLPNPFKGLRPKKERTASKHLSDTELVKLFYTRTLIDKYDGKNTIKTVNRYRYYFMLMFYLGGIDMVDLASLRYDRHVKDGRVQFYRSKGGTNAFINNKILPQAFELLKNFDCKPYLIPAYKHKDYKSFVNKMNTRLNASIVDLEITRVLTKGARYSFINRAQQLLIDERITMELVGHVQQSTHSIYTNEFPLSVRDDAHERIVGVLPF